MSCDHNKTNSSNVPSINGSQEQEIQTATRFQRATVHKLAPEGVRLSAMSGRKYREVQEPGACDTVFTKNLNFRTFTLVDPKPIDWLWQGRLAIGKLTLVTGNGGAGKSMLAADIAARVSSGEAFPGMNTGRKGDVLILGGEDSAEDTLRPRLDAAGADPYAVYLVQSRILPPEVDDEPELTETEQLSALEERLLGSMKEQESDSMEEEEPASFDDDFDWFDLAKDMEQLDNPLSACLDSKLLVVDPIIDYLGTHANGAPATSVRRVLARLQEFAEWHQVAVLIVDPCSKTNETGSDNRSLISEAISQFCRIELRVCEDPLDSGRRSLLPVKNNLANAPSLAFQIETAANGAGVVKWEKGTGDSAIQEAESTKGASKSSPR